MKCQDETSLFPSIPPSLPLSSGMCYRFEADGQDAELVTMIENDRERHTRFLPQHQVRPDSKIGGSKEAARGGGGVAPHHARVLPRHQEIQEEGFPEHIFLALGERLEIEK